MKTLAIKDAFPVVGADGRYHAHLAELCEFKVSGVYAIVGPRGSVLYVGESHSGRLYDTITRHFRRWKLDPKNDALGRRRGGTTYDRAKVRVVYLITEAADAAGVQYAEIQRLRPRDNTIECESCEIPI